LPIEQALRELRSNSGTQFDPPIVEVFVREFEKGLRAAA
jgi:HD-GYP domain-containing protein (c-di-GMP phosphodiesterase class II)